MCGDKYDCDQSLKKALLVWSICFTAFFILLSFVWLYVSIVPGRNLRKKVASTVLARSSSIEKEL